MNRLNTVPVMINASDSPKNRDCEISAEKSRPNGFHLRQLELPPHIQD